MKVLCSSSMIWRTKNIVFIAMMWIFLLSYPVCAEMYRYKDAGGVVRFTDNLAGVPEKLRAGMSVYENEPSPAMPSAAEKQPSSQNSLGGGLDLKTQIKPENVNAIAETPPSGDISNDPSRIDQLLKIKSALDSENAQFVKESLALSEEKKTLSGSIAIKAFNEKISALNARVEDYEKRRGTFQKEADAFDANLQKRMAPAPQSPQPSLP